MFMLYGEVEVVGIFAEAFASGILSPISSRLLPEGILRAAPDSYESFG